jgi:hypothetical protein
MMPSQSAEGTADEIAKHHDPQAILGRLHVPSLFLQQSLASTLAECSSQQLKQLSPRNNCIRDHMQTNNITPDNLGGADCEGVFCYPSSLSKICYRADGATLN